MYMNYKPYYLYIFIFCSMLVAFLLRTYLLTSHLFFGPEQGRDFLVVRDMVLNHKWTLIGPKTDIEGIFHGAFYYELIAVPFAFSHGNPLLVSFFLIFIQSMTVYFIFLLSFELTTSKRTGYIASILFTVSFGAIVYARWLANPPLSIPLSVLFFLFFMRFIRGNRWYLVGVSIIYGLLGQVEFINYLLFAVISTACFLFYRNKLKHVGAPVFIVAGTVGSIVAFSQYILFDLRHNFLISKSLQSLMSKNSGYNLSFGLAVNKAVSMYINQSAYALGIPYMWVGVVWTILVLIFLLSRTKKIKGALLLILWLIVPPIMVALLRHSVPEQLYVGIIAGCILGAAIFINWFFDNGHKTIGAGIMSILLCINLFALFRNLPNNFHVFFQTPQPMAYYSDQLAVIDWIHEQSNGSPYTIQAYTIPYFWQDHWDYLFWYKRTNDQVKTISGSVQTRTFVISQKDRSNSLFFNKWYSDTLARYGKVVRDYETGEFLVEERKTQVL